MRCTSGEGEGRQQQKKELRNGKEIIKNLVENFHFEKMI